MNKFFLGLISAAFLGLASLGGTSTPASACNDDPCVHHKPQVIIKYVYVNKAPPVKQKRKKPAVMYVAAKSQSECVYVPFSHGAASQPVIFFRHKSDARCLEGKSFCQKCTAWINKQRGPVYGPASRTGGGIAYAVSPGSGVMLPRDNKGVIAYCDQAVGNSTYSWGLRE
jgi:hypothetical protein